MIKNRYNILIFLLLYVSLASCSEEEKVTSTTIPPTVSTDSSETFYTGTVYLNNDTTPAPGFYLYLLNHDEGTFSSYVTGNSGAFAIPLKVLRRFNTYSLHVIDDAHKYVATVLIDGVDNFTFIGGSTADLGSIVISRDTFGVVDIANSTIDISPSGGITAGTASGALEDFPFDDTYQSVKLGGNLFIYDNETMLNSFYLSATNTSEYNNSILEWSAFRITATLLDSANDTVKGGILKNASSTAKGGRVLVDQTQAPRLQPTWSSRSLNLIITNNTIDTTVYPGRIIGSDEFLAFDLLHYTGFDSRATSTNEFLGQLGLMFSMPPLITGMNQGSSTTLAIDYTSSSDENGLTRPFCRTSGDVYFELSGPTAFEALDVTYDDLSTATVYFKYYYDLNGVRTLAELETNPDNDALITSDYPIGYSSPFSNSSLSYASRDWNPHAQTLRFNFSTSGTIGVHNLQIYSALMLESITSLNNTPVTEIELEIIYEGDKHRTGVKVVFENCP